MLADSQWTRWTDSPSDDNEQAKYCRRESLTTWLDNTHEKSRDYRHRFVPFRGIPPSC